jgi:hypothetical protein
MADARDTSAIINETSRAAAQVAESRGMSGAQQAEVERNLNLINVTGRTDPGYVGYGFIGGTPGQPAPAPVAATLTAPQAQAAQVAAKPTSTSVIASEARASDIQFVSLQTGLPIATVQANWESGENYKSKLGQYSYSNLAASGISSALATGKGWSPTSGDIRISGGQGGGASGGGYVTPAPQREPLFSSVSQSQLDKITTTQEFKAANAPGVIGGMSLASGGYTSFVSSKQVANINLSPTQSKVIEMGAFVEGLPGISYLHERASISQAYEAAHPEDVGGNFFRGLGQAVILQPESTAKLLISTGGIYAAAISGDKQAFAQGVPAARASYSNVDYPRMIAYSAIFAGLGVRAATTKPFSIEAQVFRGTEIEAGAARGSFQLAYKDFAQAGKSYGGSGEFSLKPNQMASTVFRPYEFAKVGEMVKISAKPAEYSVSSLVENKPIPMKLAFEEGGFKAYTTGTAPEGLIQRQAISGVIGRKGTTESFVRDVAKRDIVVGGKTVGEEYFSLVAVKGKGAPRIGTLRTTIPVDENIRTYGGGGGFSKYVQEMGVVRQTKIIQETVMKTATTYIPEEFTMATPKMGVTFSPMQQTKTVERFVTTEKPVTFERAVSIERPVTIERPITTQRPITSERAIMSERLVSVLRPVATERPITTPNVNRTPIDHPKNDNEREADNHRESDNGGKTDYYTTSYYH